MRKLLFCLCLASVIMTAEPGWALTMTFDTARNDSAVSYTEGAMTVATLTPNHPTHFHLTDVGPTSVAEGGNDGYLGIHNGNGAENARFSLAAGGTFDVLSFDMSTWVKTGDSQVQFDASTGTFLAGTARATKQIVTFSGPKWTNLTWFQITMVSCSSGCPIGLATAAIDNFQYTINATTVPEPTTLLLMGSGLVAMLAFRKKIHKNV